MSESWEMSDKVRLTMVKSVEFIACIKREGEWTNMEDVTQGEKNHLNF